MLNYQGQSNSVQSLTKTRQENDMTDHMTSLYFKKKLNYHDRSDRVRIVMMSKQHNKVNDHRGAVYDENETRL